MSGSPLEDVLELDTLTGSDAPPEGAARPLVDRELSWLAFNGRVLQEAMDPSVPLFERLSFLAIFSSNLDEFFRVRVASLRTLLRLKKKRVKKLSLNPSRLLREIHKVVHGQQLVFGEIFRGRVLPELERHGIHLVNETGVTPAQAAFLEGFFRREVAPVLSPVLLRRDEPAPFLADRANYLVVELWPRESISLSAAGLEYGLVDVPSPPLPRFISLPPEGDRRVVMFLDDVVRLNAGCLFPGYDVGSAYAVDVSRDAELDLEEEFSGDIVAALRKSLKQRGTGVATRFVYDQQASYALVSYLKEHFGLEDEDLMMGGRYHNLHDLRAFPRPVEAGSGLAYDPWRPAPHPKLSRAASILDAVAERDQVLHFPYQSYDPVLRLLQEAAADPSVEEIDLTVYRVSPDSAVLAALIGAVQRGKTVRVFVEVQARFDEITNLEWAERMERAGVAITYSIPGIKVHGKLALVTRRERGEPRRYALLSTGNFNERTAVCYADMALLTADPRITTDVETVFAYLRGEMPVPVFSHLLVAPFYLRAELEALIEAEIEAARAGAPSGIVAKMNALEDEEMVALLYRASAAGVPIDLIVRGICCLVPGEPGLSETVRARSVVDRHLEHSRVWIFHNRGDERVFLASADWMTRNLDHRVEVAVPLYDPEVRRQVREMVALHLRDDTKARVLDARLSNRYVARDGGAPLRAQEASRRFVDALGEAGP